MDPDTLEYFRVRGVIEEHNANIMVEDFIDGEEQRAVWLIFDPTSDLLKIPEQISDIVDDFDLSIVVFKIGASFPIAYITPFDSFYTLRAMNILDDISTSFDKYKIPSNKMRSMLNGMLIEDKRRTICYGPRKISRPKHVSFGRTV